MPAFGVNAELRIKSHACLACETSTNYLDNLISHLTALHESAEETPANSASITKMEWLKRVLPYSPSG